MRRLFHALTALSIAVLLPVAVWGGGSLPPVPLASTTVAGKVKCDGTTTSCAADGTVTATAGGNAGINQLTGDVAAGPAAGSATATIVSNAVTTAKINAAAVTYGKIQSGASTGLLGVNNGAAPSEVALGSGLSLSGGTLSAAGGGGSSTGVGVDNAQSPQGYGNTAQAMAGGHFYYFTNAAFTAPRIWTLPASATACDGTSGHACDIEAADAQQTLTTSNTLTLCAAGSDTVNKGSAGSCTIALYVAGSAIGLHNDGAGNWQVTYVTAAPTLGSAQIYVGDANSLAEARSLSGDCSLSNAGAITCTKTSGTNLGTFATANAAAPPAIGGTTPAAGSFTTLGATGNLTTNITGSTQCVHANSSGVLAGTGSDCGAGGGGYWTQIGTTTTVAGGTDISFTGISGFKLLELRCWNISTSTSADIQVRVSTSATFRTANYEFTVTFNGGISGSGAYSGFGNTAQAAIVPVTTASTQTVPIAGFVQVYGASLTTAPKPVIFDFEGTTAAVAYQVAKGGGAYTGDNGAIDGLRLLPSTGTISGSCALVGAN